MAIRMQDIGELAYGGLVTGAEWWDSNRITQGTLLDSEVFKKAGFYAYLVPGLFATLASAFGWWRRQELWVEHISHGFLYDVPRFLYKTVQSMGTTTAGRRTQSEAIRQAQQILAQRQRGPQPSAPSRQLPTGASTRILTPNGEEVIASVT